MGKWETAAFSKGRLLKGQCVPSAGPGAPCCCHWRLFPMALAPGNESWTPAAGVGPRAGTLLLYLHGLGWSSLCLFSSLSPLYRMFPCCAPFCRACHGPALPEPCKCVQIRSGFASQMLCLQTCHHVQNWVIPSALKRGFAGSTCSCHASSKSPVGRRCEEATGGLQSGAMACWGAWCVPQGHTPQRSSMPSALPNPPTVACCWGSRPFPLHK